MQAFILLAAIGLAFSAIVHLSTFLWFEPQTTSPISWLMIAGVIATFIPAMIVQARSKDKRDQGDDVLDRLPGWAQKLMGLVALYIIVNFCFLVFVIKGSPTREADGSYTVRSHGTVIRQISARQYRLYRGIELRVPSGHCMLFYGASMLILIGAKRRQDATRAQPVGTSNEGVAPGQTLRLEYTAHGGVIMPLWLHQTFLVGAALFAWIGVPGVLIMGLLPLLDRKLGSPAASTIMMIFWAAGFAAPVLLWRYLPARCPHCGGRAYCSGIFPAKYACRDCGKTDLRPPESQNS